MLTDFTIDETFIGQTIGPANAYLVNLSRTQAPTRYEIPDWDPGRQCWKTARFVLRGSGDFRDLCCIDAQSDGGWGGSGTGFVLGHASISYRGELEVRCVPKGSQWKVTVSDIPYVHVPPPWPLAARAAIFPLDIREREREYARR